MTYSHAIDFAISRAVIKSALLLFLI